MVRDYFAQLEEPRRPWLDEDALTSKFHRLSQSVHPDRTHGSTSQEQAEANRRFAELNAAHQCLQSIKERLQHLLALESGTRPSRLDEIPPEAAELFDRVALLGAESDRLLARRSAITSPLLRVAWFQESLTLAARIQDLLALLRTREQAVHDQLRAMNAAWETAPLPGHPARPSALPMAELEQAYRSLSYLVRWIAQLQERLVQLAL